VVWEREITTENVGMPRVPEGHQKSTKGTDPKSTIYTTKSYGSGTDQEQEEQERTKHRIWRSHTHALKPAEAAHSRGFVEAKQRGWKMKRRSATCCILIIL
jgi:hypothetical protein